MVFFCFGPAWPTAFFTLHLRSKAAFMRTFNKSLLSVFSAAFRTRLSIPLILDSDGPLTLIKLRAAPKGLSSDMRFLRALKSWNFLYFAAIAVDNGDLFDLKLCSNEPTSTFCGG